MKPALRWIPAEVWVDVFCYPWISRKKLGKLVHKFRNRYFAEILQYCLHERGRRMLRSLTFNKKTLPRIPRIPLPENIKSFEEIKICHFNWHALAFLRQISALPIEVNLFFFRIGTSTALANLRPILDHLVPLFHGIHSLEFEHRALPIMQQYFGPNMEQIKMLALDLEDDGGPTDTIQAAVNFALDWLHSEERHSNEPRMLMVDYAGSEIFQQFSTAVKEHFLAANRPCTFAIKFMNRVENIPHFHEENNNGEQLQGQFIGRIDV